MPFLKSEHSRAVTTLIGTNILGMVNYRGVEMPRAGLNDPLVPFTTNYDTKIPNANVTFPMTGAGLGIVWAFPLNAVPVSNQGETRATQLSQYRKPRYPGRKA